MISPNDIAKGSLVRYNSDLPDIDKVLDKAFNISNIVGIVLDKRNKSKIALVSWHNSPFTNTPTWVEYKYLQVVEQ